MAKTMEIMETKKNKKNYAKISSCVSSDSSWV